MNSSLTNKSDSHFLSAAVSKQISSAKVPDNHPLEALAKQCQQRGNRLEVMNGKIYEVSRKLIGEIK